MESLSWGRVPRTQETTRLAPSPTGALHLGNARTFLVNWALARRRGWRVVLRIEDLDGPRVKPGAAESCIDTLRWLGIDWDEGPLVQSHDLAPYTLAMETLASRGAAYACELTRSEIEQAASAPQATIAGDAPGETRFPASLRPAPPAPTRFADTGTNWRFATPETSVEFVDAFAGPQRLRPCDTIGDFVVWTRRGQPAYQLAVVVDDHRQGITQVVRGNDLLDSAARQILLSRALGTSPEPCYIHLPLVVGPDGRRLAKRHGDTRLETYRALGVAPARVVGLAAYWCGMLAGREELAPRAFADALDMDSIPRENVACTEEDDRWLRAGAR